MKYLFSSIMIVCLCLIACDVREDAVGSYQNIMVLVDAGEADILAPRLSEALEVEIITPRAETIFTLNYVDSTKIDRMKIARTSIIAASLESPGQAGRFIRGSLSPEALRAVEGGEWIIAKKDLWANGQLTVILAAPTVEALEARIFLGAEELFRLVNNSVNERHGEWLFGRVFTEGEKIALQDSIAGEYGWAIRIPRYWDWEKGSYEERFLWLRALEPERWIFVWWTPLDSSMDFSVERWQHVRDSLCEIYYEGDIVSAKFEPETTGVMLGNRPAVQIRALWENPHTLLGGPIISYVLSDPMTNRLFIIDGAVFAPAVKKMPYLRQVEIVCRSFRADVPKFYEERKERGK
ncbi:MAG TPA: DUF4837 family protein [candidate division Zixibacteria bacterium]|nr:DUF4837 family protein [candidate division Zixibacteria bacterium]